MPIKPPNINLVELVMSFIANLLAIFAAMIDKDNQEDGSVIDSCLSIFATFSPCYYFTLPQNQCQYTKKDSQETVFCFLLTFINYAMAIFAHSITL